MAVQHTQAVQQLSSAPRRTESCPSVIGPISLEVKQMGARSAGNPHAACDECFSYIKDWVEKKVRRHMAHARKRKGFGWEQWSRPWLYNTLKLFNSYRVRRDGPKAALA